MDLFFVGFLFFILLVVVAFKGINQVPQGYVWTVERFGRFIYVLKPGLTIIWPFIDHIGRKINIMEQVLDIPPQKVISKDNAMVNVDAVAYFRVIDPVKAAYSVNDLMRSLMNISMTNLRTVLGALEIDQMLSQRDQINQELIKSIDEATDAWGVKITRVEIRDIEPPKDLVDAMAAQLKAERDKRAQILQAEGYKSAAILQAEGDKAKIFLESEARERQALAEAKSTELVSNAIKSGDPKSLNYFIAQEYVKSLQNLAHSDNSKVYIMPMELTSIASSITGISSLFKEIDIKENK